MQTPKNFLKDLDYSVVQQCMHCGMCLPACPTYQETGREKNSPRGRIALMRAIADGELEVSRNFGEEMSYCLGCLACTTACPANVDYPHLFEMARATAESHAVLDSPRRRLYRRLTIHGLFMHPRLLRLAGRALWLYQRSGMQSAFRKLRLTRLLPADLRRTEPMTPNIESKFSNELIAKVERPQEIRHRVLLLTGCVQDLVFASVNRDTADALLANHCEVVTPKEQYCCGSLHAHNGEIEAARELARKQLALINPADYDAIITNAAGCGSHLKHYDRLLEGETEYEERAREWSRRTRDIHEWLCEIGIKPVSGSTGGEAQQRTVTYHEACHLCHGQKISRQPRELLKAIPGLNLVELPDATNCCGSAGVYNITQPEQAGKLLDEKVTRILSTGAGTVATGNPGCILQIRQGLKDNGIDVVHPVSLLAEAYRREAKGAVSSTSSSREEVV